VCSWLLRRTAFEFLLNKVYDHTLKEEDQELCLWQVLGEQDFRSTSLMVSFAIRMRREALEALRVPASAELE